MAVVDPKKDISFKIDKDFASFFDELENIQISNRKSDVGFVEDGAYMVRPRDGTSLVGNVLSGSTGIQAMCFYSDNSVPSVRRHYIAYNGSLYYLSGATWTQVTGVALGAGEVSFNVVRLPATNPTAEFTTPADATTAERVKKDAGDAGGASNVGKYLVVTSGVYKGAWSNIATYDSTTSEYTLGNSGVISVLKSGEKYRVFDTLGYYLQANSTTANDEYVNGTTREAIFSGFATASLRQVKAIGGTEYAGKMISFNNSSWTWKNKTLFYSYGYNSLYENPMFFNITSALTLPGSGTISDLFKFRGKLVIGGDNFVSYLDSYNSAIKTISTSYGLMKNSLVDLGQDCYFLTQDKQLISLSENIAGTIVPDNVSKTVSNYVKKFSADISSGFDGKRFYLYGSEVAGTPGTLVVFDMVYRFWSTYTGLRPSKIVSDAGTCYLGANNSGTVSKFDPLATADVGVAFSPKAASKELYLGDPFSMKAASDFYIWMENYTQDFQFDLYYAITGSNGKKLGRRFTFAQTDPGTKDGTLGSDTVGSSILGGTSYSDKISFPILSHIQLAHESAHAWKFIVTGTFYINEIVCRIGPYGEPKGWFPASRTS